MKIIKRYTNQKYFNPHLFLRDKGYKAQADYAQLNHSIQIEGRWSEIWTVHLNQGEHNYMLVRQKQPPYMVYVIDLEDSIVTSLMAKHLIEEGVEPKPRHFFDFLDPSLR